MLRMEDFGQPARIKYIPLLAFSVTRRRPTTDRTIKPPGGNWVQVFQKRHLELNVIRVRVLDWKHYDKNIYDKITHWFEMMGKELQNLHIALK